MYILKSKWHSLKLARYFCKQLFVHGDFLICIFLKYSN